ncbi:MAG: response regulator [Lachnospiraceae bacterium]|nr:response regulator [Lachnospiraceae bacterium]
MTNVLFISHTKGFILSSLASQLEAQGHNIKHVSDRPSEIDQAKKDIHLILLNAEQLDMEGLIYIKDMAIEENIPIFVIGDVNELKNVQSVIPEQFIKKEFLRPVNVKDILSQMDGYLRKEAGQKKKKILVVDDCGAMLRSVKEWLQDKYQVIVANSGAMAIKYLAMNRPDLILLDYEMPVCDGKQVLEMIRSESEFSAVPVIFLTGKNDRESVLSVSNLKPEGYLLKTMPPAQIVQTIDDFFEKKKAQI